MNAKFLAERTGKLELSPIRKVFEKVQDAQRRGIDVVNLSVGRPDFDTPAHIKAAAQQAIEQGQVHYTSSPGLMELREAVCRRLADDHQLHYDPTEVLISVGATQAIFAALQTVLNPGDEVLIPEPMYVYYMGWSQLCQASGISIPLNGDDDFRLNIEEIRKRVTPRTKVFILTSPHNPTGQVFEKSDLAELGKLAVENDFLIISDDIYSRLLYDDLEYYHVTQDPEVKERTIVIGSFSKCYAMDGWRIGYMAGPRDIMAAALKIHQYMISCPNTFVQIGAHKALTDSQDCVAEMVAEFDRRRTMIMDRLDAMAVPYVRPRGAFYIFPSIKHFGMDSEAFCNYIFEEAKTAVVPGSAFGPSGEGYIRMSYATAYDRIEESMDRIAAAIKRI
jgi:aminotransferase